METINITSMTSAEEQIMERKAHITAFQQPCMKAKMLGAGQAEARKHNKTLEAGPPDPEHGRTSRGVGVIAQNVLTPIALVKPSKAYEEAAATGNIIRAPHGSVATNKKQTGCVYQPLIWWSSHWRFLGLEKKIYALASSRRIGRHRRGYTAG